VLDERELIQKALKGDEAAQAAFVGRYEERLYRTAIHFLGYRDPDARDMVQETFAIAWAQLPDFRFEAVVYTWLNRICVNLCYDRLRQRKRQLVTQDRDIELALQGLAASRDQGADEAGLMQQRSQLLREQLGFLKERCRQLIDLRDLQGLSYAELGRQMRLPLGTVMSSLARCREALRLRIQRVWREAGGG
jgi:RNA polymerase sigma factor (sigma-70 family)